MSNRPHRNRPHRNLLLRDVLASEDRNSVTFDEVESDGTFRILGDLRRAAASANWYIVWCRKCQQDFNGIKRSLEASAVSHLNTAKHADLGQLKGRDHLIKHLGIRVLNCTAKKAKVYNARLRQRRDRQEAPDNEPDPTIPPSSPPASTDSEGAMERRSEGQPNPSKRSGGGLVDRGRVYDGHGVGAAQAAARRSRSRITPLRCSRSRLTPFRYRLRYQRRHNS